MRWIASHEILGYRENGDANFKDEARLLHGCLKQWRELDDATKQFDYNVVENSLNIAEFHENE